MTVDLTNCAAEPIHVIGRIQSFGYLVAVSADWVITFISANLTTILGEPAAAMIGRRAQDILGEEAIHALRSRLQLLSTTLSVERIFGMELFTQAGQAEAPPLYDVALHRSGRHIVIEAEPSDTSALAKYVNYVRPMTERVKQAGDARAMCDMAARQMRALTGFDRVMVYRFAEDESGEVIAESRASGTDSFMGMHFPGSDIPRQARELYTRNLLRLISDVADPTVMILPAGDDADGLARAPLDLTMSTLRAVSPIHIEYLTNMGVRASMSASIVRDGKLWGLFACHHYQPLKLTYPVRTAAELFAEALVFLLEQSERRHSQELAAKAGQVHVELMSRLADGGSLISHFDHLAEAVAPVIPHDGLAAWIDGELVCHGAVPAGAEMAALIDYLVATGTGRAWASDCLAQAFAPAAAYQQRCAGLLALSVSRQPGDFIMLFRREVSFNKPWGGNPQKIQPENRADLGPNGHRLTPRKSFELWNEMVVGHCRDWTADELQCAEAIQVTLREIVVRLIDAAAADRERARRENEFLIAELNHRSRNMLNLVRGLVSQSQTSSTSIAEFARNIDDRIESLARAHDQLTHAHHAPVSLHRLIATESRAYAQDSDDQVIVVSGDDVLIAPGAVTTLTLVIHELMTNSRKYGALSRVTQGRPGGQLYVNTARDAAGNLNLHWQESGGPPVTPPTRRGFGTTILERAIPHELGGTVAVEFQPEGLVARISLPAQHMVAAAPPPPLPDLLLAELPLADPSSAIAVSDASLLPEAAGSKASPAARPRFAALVVEDNMLIAMDAEEALHDLGASEVQLCPSVSSALDSIATAAFDVALLDVNLGNETSEAIALTLRERGTPFVMTTGFGDYISDIAAYAGAPVLTKPYAPAALARALAQVMD